jgi:transposase
MAFEGASPMSVNRTRPSESATENALEKERKNHNGKRHDREFKVAAVKLVTEQRYTRKQAALRLGVKPSTFQYWIKVYGPRPLQQQAETMETVRMTNKQLEAENQRLKLERKILKKATAFFASQQP